MRKPDWRLILAAGMSAVLLAMPSTAAAGPAVRAISTADDRGGAEVRISTREAQPARRATASATVSVAILDFLYDPKDVTVSRGDTVSWTNQGEKKHDVTSDGFESETLEAGDGYSFTFTESGTFDYLCGIHPKMKGTVTVAGTPSQPDGPADGEPKQGSENSSDPGSESAGRQGGGEGSDGGDGESDSGGVSSGSGSGGGAGGDSDGSLPSTGQDLLPALILAELLLIGGLLLRLRVR